jgi:hypothetical protein
MNKAKFNTQDVAQAIAEFMHEAVATETNIEVDPEIQAHRNGPIRVYTLNENSGEA